MTMLIKGGMIHTMTEQGCFRGDILVRQGRIVSVAEQVTLPKSETACVLDADGLTILPGMLDTHIHDSPKTEEKLLQSSAASGVTGGLLWPEEEGACQLLLGDNAEESHIFAIQSDGYSDAQLHERLLSLAESGRRAACEVHDPGVCRRLLAAVQSTGVPVILVHLTGCEDMLEAIARSGCAAVVGVNHHRSGCPWKMACGLDGLGVQAALTCNYPDAKLRHLPLCAALCVRDGMDRERALRCVTTVPAALLGLPEAGVIRAGARADLAIYDGDPLLLATSHVMTITGGKIRH